MTTQTPKRLIGIEAKLELTTDNCLFLEQWGSDYQSIMRHALNLLQNGVKENQLEKDLQLKYNIHWAWAGSIVNDASSTYNQLLTSKNNQIKQLETSLKSALKNLKNRINRLDKTLKKKAFTKEESDKINKELLGLTSTLNRLERQQHKLNKLKSSKRVHIVFGSKRLFKSQHWLKDNQLKSHQDWLTHWRKKRSGNFFSIGKGSVKGNNPSTGILHNKDNQFKVVIKSPYYLQNTYGKEIVIDFQVPAKFTQDLLYGIANNYPVTVRCFRREEKQDAWYIGLTTYVPQVPTLSQKNNGCLGIDLNANSIDVSYVKKDGNLTQTWSFKLPNQALNTGQTLAKLRDVCKKIVSIAHERLCPIVIEKLDFSTKKAQLKEMPKKYNRMLSGFIYNKFKETLASRCDKYGIKLIQVNPAYSSVIGMIKFMPRYGLQSGTAQGYFVLDKENRGGLGVGGWVWGVGQIFINNKPSFF